MSGPLTSSLDRQVMTLVSPYGNQQAYVEPSAAANIPYTPAQPANWPVPPPANVAQALDYLAAKPVISTAVNATPLGPLGSIIAVSISVTPTLTRRYVCYWTINQSLNAADGVNAGIYLDGVIQAPSGTALTASSAPAALSGHIALSVTAGVHVWTLRTATVGSGLISIPSQQARLTLLEY